MDASDASQVSHLQVPDLHREVQHKAAELDAQRDAHARVPAPHHGRLQDGLVVAGGVRLGAPDGRRLLPQVENLNIHGLDEGVLRMHRWLA